MMETCMHHSIYVAFKIIDSNMHIHHSILCIYIYILLCELCVYIYIYIY